MTRAQIKIVAGSHRGRALEVDVHPGLRPTPTRVRESLFNILGHAVPDRPFFDVFAGSGVIGLEALSRGASRAYFVERDGRLAGAIDASVAKFRFGEKARIVRGDVYRWAERWLPPGEAVNIYLSPPFPDLSERPDEFRNLVSTLQRLAPPASVLTVQLEAGYDESLLPHIEKWDIRRYGRNILAFWEPEAVAAETPSDPAQADE
ncbi:MAG: RsmD family RNA methyltransferase [Gemmataceae bacterium]|nr:RsmD family RNA methyltransferase [Gemmataceae bacterium]